MEDFQGFLLQTLGGRRGGACFVPELRAALGSRQVADAEFERALAELERCEAIVVRPQFCGDPHLDGADLRIAARLVASSAEEDAQAAAMTAIDATWQRWLGDYLASHRCT